MRFLLQVILCAVMLYVTVPPIVRFLKDWRSLHFAMSRTGNPLSDEPRSLWLESLRQMNASGRHGDFANAIGMVAVLILYGAGYMIAGMGGAIAVLILAIAIAFWRLR